MKNKLIPIILFAMAICAAIYCYAVFPSFIVFGGKPSPGLCNTDCYPPIRLLFVFVGFFIIFIILGTLQNRAYSQSKPLSSVTGPANRKELFENRGT